MKADLREGSVEIIRDGQAPSGAYIASPNFDVYKYAWLRDGAFIAYGMDRAGEHDSAAAFHRWVSRTVLRVAAKVEALEAKADRGEEIGALEWLHCRYTLDGQEGQEPWGAFQLDGYGTWLWALDQHVTMTGDQLLLAECTPAMDLLVRYLTRFWDRPNFDCWEEHGEEVHPATLACIYGGLSAANRYRHDPKLERECEAIRAYVLSRFVHDGRLSKLQGGRSVDANLLWVSVPFGLIATNDPIMVNTVTELERRLRTGGVHRYPEDTYYGGGEWLILTAWLGWYHVQAGNPHRAHELLRWIEEQATPEGFLPEQVTGRALHPDRVQPWLERWGPVATPLLWSHAMYLVLRDELAEAESRS